MKKLSLICTLLLFLICLGCTRKGNPNQNPEQQAAANNARNFVCPDSGFGPGKAPIVNIHSSNDNFYTYVCSSEQSLNDFKKDSKGYILKDYSIYFILSSQGKAFKALEGSSPSAVRLSKKDNTLIISENAYVFGEFQNVFKTVFTCGKENCVKSKSKACIIDYVGKKIDPAKVKELDLAIKKNKVTEKELNLILDLALLGHELSQAYMQSEFAYFFSAHLKEVFFHNQYIYSQLKQRDCVK